MSVGSKNWFEFERELRRHYATATWVPLRACISKRNNIRVDEVGFFDDGYYVGTVAFPNESEDLIEKVSWDEIGLSHSGRPYAYSNGKYKRCNEYQYNDNETIGYNLVFENYIPESEHREWIIDPDIILALRLQKSGNNWIRPEEDFCVVIREKFNSNGEPELIEIRKEFLLDYLSARQLNIKISEYRQRVINFEDIDKSPYGKNIIVEEEREGAKFSLIIRSISDVFGGTAAIFKVWRTDFDHEEDSPFLPASTDENTEAESYTIEKSTKDGVRVESQYWRDEVIRYTGKSERVRGDKGEKSIEFIVDTYGNKEDIERLNNDDVGKWLFFKYDVINDLLSRREYGIEWYTAETGGVSKKGDRSTHFGINNNDLINVYAYDIYLRPAWEQRIWSLYNVIPEGGISEELAASQVRATPANTTAPEEKLIHMITELDKIFYKIFKRGILNRSIDISPITKKIHRFRAVDDESIFSLAKDITRVFIDRIDREALRIASGTDDKKLGSIKLIERLLGNYIGLEEARRITAPIVGVYDLRIADAHPTSSKIEESFELIGIDRSQSYLKQAFHMIDEYACSIWKIGITLYKQTFTSG